MEQNSFLTFLKNIYIKFLDASQFILFIVAILLIGYMFVIQPHEVSGSSMYPTFKNKDFLLSYIFDVQVGGFTNSRTLGIRHGDVVVFHSPVEKDKLYIKRVIGLPGDRVKLENGVVYFNGTKLDESEYLDSSVATYGGSYLQDGTEVTVEPLTFFVMGDNRPYSSDSRAWGMLPFKELIGRSLLRFYPPQALKFVSRDPYR